MKMKDRLSEKGCRQMLKGLCAWRGIGVLLMLLLFAAGCKKEPVNRDIEGHWQLLQFTVLETGEVVPCYRLYFGITHKMTKVMEKQGEHGDLTYSALTEYREHESQLVLKDFKSGVDHIGNVLDTPVEQLLPFGINSQKETIFRVLKSSHKKMVLESDYARLELKKF